MRVVNHYDPIKNYLDMLCAEMAVVSRYIQNPIRIKHLHFGGGSPTSLKPDDFRRLVDGLSKHFDFSEDIEICLEADPRNMSEAKIAAYAKTGVNRVSLGVQSFDDKVLKTINRPQPFSTSYRAVQLCRDYGIRNINLDLMYGLPYQTVQSVKGTIDSATLLTPNRISFFGYAHVPWMKKHMALIPEESLPDIHTRYDSAIAGHNLLVESGYHAIGLDHFVVGADSMMAAYQAKQLRRNFQGYTTDTANTMIGLGVSSIGSFEGGYIQNHPDIKPYSESLKRGCLPSSRILNLNPDDIIRRAVIEEVMCYLEVDLGDICQKFALAKNYFDANLARLTPYMNDGLVEVSGGMVRVPKDRSIFVRIVASAFDDYFFDEEPIVKRHAQAI